MNIEKILYHSGMNQFLYNRGKILKFHQGGKQIYIIALTLNIKETAYIKDNFDEFKKIAENILFTVNSNSTNYYNNITFGSLQQGEKRMNNCFLLYNSQRNLEGFVETRGIVQLPAKKKVVKGITLYDRVAELIKQQQLSVRNLMKLGIIQTRARELYNSLKMKEVFKISKYNNSQKVYNFENFQKIEKSEIEQILQGGV